jgi:DNA-binding beta-propeller fold protein YncE
MHRNEAPIATSAEVFPMPEPGMIPEDIDYDPASKQFYVSSVVQKEILALDGKGHSRVFGRAPDSWPMMALKIDSKRRVLWATEVALNGFVSVPKTDWRTSAILIYHLDSGKLLHRIPGPAHATLGDLALTPEGNAIVSDNDGGVYRVDRETKGVERVDQGDFISPQTAAVDPDGRHVFVPDYLRGVAILDLKTKQVSWLDGGGTHALSGIDGLYLSGRTLIATQNGTSPERVVRFQLDESLRTIESETVIERSTSGLGDPTHGVVAGGKFYYIANSGWDRIEDDGRPKAGTTPARALLMRADLAPPAK